MSLRHANYGVHVAYWLLGFDEGCPVTLGYNIRVIPRTLESFRQRLRDPDQRRQNQVSFQHIGVVLENPSVRANNVKGITQAVRYSIEVEPN